MSARLVAVGGARFDITGLLPSCPDAALLVLTAGRLVDIRLEKCGVFVYIIVLTLPTFWEGGINYSNCFLIEDYLEAL